MPSHPTIDADICVVGAGIVGLAHAFDARDRGMTVAVLDRDHRAVGASVRNFGHGFVAAMADGDALDAALLARDRWLHLGRRAGLEVLQAGSLVVARHEDELAVMAAVANDERREARLISSREIGELAPIPVEGVVGALHTRLDFRVDPRTSVARLAALLQEDPGARVVWNATVRAVSPGEVHTDRVAVRAPLTVICPGPDFRSLPPELWPGRAGLTTCKLQMLRVAPPAGRRYLPALLTGLSLLRYPAFTSRPECATVRARVEAECPDVVAAGIHLIVTQLPDGDLILGDTHEYAETVSPFGEERLDRLVLAEAQRLLGIEQLTVHERWHGVYPMAPGEPFMVSAPLPGVRLVEVVSGVGMTTALGLAPRVLDELIGDLSAGDGNRPAVRLGAQPPPEGLRSGYGS